MRGVEVCGDMSRENRFVWRKDVASVLQLRISQRDTAHVTLGICRWIVKDITSDVSKLLAWHCMHVLVLDTGNTVCIDNTH